MTLFTRMVSLANPWEKPYKFFDHAGLYLYVRAKGSKSWRSRQYKNGREGIVTWGKYPAMSLAEARASHASGLTIDMAHALQPHAVAFHVGLRQSDGV